jgi:NADP-dependent 3-hydroxy acid dehydrogenase YdfG
MVGRVVMPTRLVTIQDVALLAQTSPSTPEVLAKALQPEDVAAAVLFVLRLPTRAHVPELVLYPSQL